MSKELEIEFKTLLTKDEYIKLCEKFKDCKEIFKSTIILTHLDSLLKPPI